METNCRDVKRASILVTFYMSINEVFLTTKFRTLELNWTCLDLALIRYSDTNYLCDLGQIINLTKLCYLHV